MDVDTSSGPHDAPLVPELACSRRSQRRCVNQALVDALRPLAEFSALRHGPGHLEAVSLAGAVSCIIGTPVAIETVDEIAKIPGVGDALKPKIQEFLDRGFIQESRDLGQSEHYAVLKLLTSVHGVGHAKANELYDQGVRTLEDLRRTMDDSDERVVCRFGCHADLQEM